jgi:hypothetical protein
MEKSIPNPTPSIWRILVTSVPKAPWTGFVFGLFLPLVLMQIGDLLQMSKLGFFLALGVCAIFFVVDFFRMMWPNAFALITLFMMTTQYGAHALAARYPDRAVACSFVTILDEGMFALLFLFSLCTRKPLILFLLGKDVAESIPETIQKSSYYLPAWKAVTLIWGVLYAVQTGVLALLIFHPLPCKEFIEFFFGWPLVAVFLVISVALPRWYWITNMPAIERENAEKRVLTEKPT